jgi:hypothetical protein
MQVVLIPSVADVEFYRQTNESHRDEMELCSQAARDVNHRRSKLQHCDSLEYSIMAELYDGAFGNIIFWAL